MGEKRLFFCDTVTEKGGKNCYNDYRKRKESKKQTLESREIKNISNLHRRIGDNDAVLNSIF
jgi:hypothetical protein